MAVAKTGAQKLGMFLMNPMVRKLDKIEETGNNTCTYGGITIKTIFLLLLTIVGGAIFFLTNDMVPTSYVENIEGISINMIEAGIVVGGLLLALILPFIAFKWVKGSMLLGSIYSIIQGYALSFCAHLFGNEYAIPMLIAFGLTIIVVIVMLLIYKLKLININKKFMSMVSTIFFTELLLGLVVFIMTLIPQTKEIAKLITDNGVLTLVISAIGVGIASLFLLVDFEVINHSVHDKLPKKYEWLGAFALSFSIIELYLKILNMILRMMQNTQKQN